MEVQEHLQKWVWQDTVAHKPGTLSLEQAAGLPLVGVSAWQALVETIGLSNGQKVLILGLKSGDHRTLS